MKAILSKTSSPYFNLATEEFLLKNCTEEFLFLYRNEKSLIIGKHQNSNLEVNIELQHQLRIPIIRRLSGGGTVFHDLGNLNFCFITNEANQRQVNFEKYAIPMKEALHQLGIEIEVGKRHEFLINGKKISGNASHIWKNRVIHHGTLLFESDTQLLQNLLKIDSSKYIDKSVKSVSSEVITIKKTNQLSYNAQAFTNLLLNKLSLILDATIENEFLNQHIEEIDTIANNKYKTWEWNYGYNPNYQFIKKTILKDGNQISINIAVEKGLIKSVETEPERKDFEKILKEVLINQPHSLAELKILLSENSAKYSAEIETEQLIQSLF